MVGYSRQGGSPYLRGLFVGSATVAPVGAGRRGIGTRAARGGLLHVPHVTGVQVSSVTPRILIDHLPETMTVVDLAAALGRSIGTIRNQVRAGLIPQPHRREKTRRRLLWDRDAIADWLKGQIAADLRATAIECETTLSDSMR